MVKGIVSAALAVLTLFSPFSSYLRRDKSAANETEQKTAQTCAVPGIICWGDSLTVGAGGDGVNYPDVLHDEIKSRIGADVEVVNMGVGGETSATIVGRSGMEPFRAQAFTIPADCTPTKIKLYSELHKRVLPMIQGENGVNPVSIGGVVGEISVKYSTVVEWSEYFFTRAEAGEAVEIEKGTPVITDVSDKYLDYVNVVFIGTNGDFKNAAELIEQQKAILSRNNATPEKYIVVGIYKLNNAQVKKAYGKEDHESFEAALGAEYGERFINLREYLTTDALDDAGIEPTDADIAEIGEGRVPPSLLVEDGLHLNSTGYTLLGKLIYERMDALGYFEQEMNNEE